MFKIYSKYLIKDNSFIAWHIVESSWVYWPFERMRFLMQPLSLQKYKSSFSHSVSILSVTKAKNNYIHILVVTDICQVKKKRPAHCVEERQDLLSPRILCLSQSSIYPPGLVYVCFSDQGLMSYSKGWSYLLDTLQQDFLIWKLLTVWIS